MMKTDITVLDRRSLIQLTLDATVATTRMPCHMVHLADFATWVDLLDAESCSLRLRADGRVDVFAGGFHHNQYVTVHSVADVVRDMPLPPDVHGEWTKLPAGEVSRLELFSGVAS